MIARIVGWTEVVGVSSIVLVPPEGPSHGIIRYHERLRPLASVAQIVQEMIARHPELQVARVGDVERLITGEGEYAALVTIGGTLAGRPAQRTLGIVFADDFHALVNGICLEPGGFDTFAARVRDLTVTDSHALGVRRRRFLYQPPAGWQPIVKGFQTEWIPRDFPLDRGMITVFPANPAAIAAAVMFDNMLAQDEAQGFKVATRKGPERVTARAGLEGLAWEVAGAFPDRDEQFKCFVVFGDPRYVYALQLDSLVRERRAAHGEAFVALVRTVEPIPSTGPRVTAAAVHPDLVTHWSQ